MQNRPAIQFLCFLTISLLTLAALSCSKPEPKKTEPQTLAGRWINVSMNVTFNHEGPADSVSTLEANEENWVEILGIKPIITTYSTDGTYVSEYRSPQDSVVGTSAGIWVTNAGILTMTDGGSGGSYSYRFDIKNDTATFIGIIDFDEDGIADDRYVGIQRRYK